MKAIIPLLIGLSLLVILVPNLVYADHDGWFAIEHCANVGCDANSNENRVVYQELGGHVDVFGSGSAQTLTQGYLAKVFDKSELDGKLVTVELALTRLNGAGVQVKIFDGEFDPLPLGACGTDCFPLDAPIVTSGSGGSTTIIDTSSANGEGVGVIKNKTGTGNLSAFDSPTDKVTLMVQQEESCGSCANGGATYQITIEDLGTYRFKPDATDNSWNGTTVICIRECNVSSGTPSSYWTVTSRPPADVIPPVISAIGDELAIFYDGDSVFDDVNCIDELGVAHPIGNFATDGGVTIDGEDFGLQSQDFTCTDEEGNVTLTTVEYLVKRESTGGGNGGTPNTSLPATISSPTPSDSGTPLLSLTGDDRSIDDIFSIFDNLFNRALDSETGQVVEQRVEETVSDVTQQATQRVQETATDTANQAYDSFINFIFGLFR